MSKRICLELVYLYIRGLEVRTNDMWVNLCICVDNPNGFILNKFAKNLAYLSQVPAKYRYNLGHRYTVEIS